MNEGKGSRVLWWKVAKYSGSLEKGGEEGLNCEMDIQQQNLSAKYSLIFPVLCSHREEAFRTEFPG